ncbi:MAG: hypothetical protein ACJ72L_17215 [Marmoricola sp.]
MTTGIGSNSGTESEASVLFGGLMTVGFGLMAVLAAIGLGWVAAAALGIVLLVVAWRVPASASARVLPYLLVGLGVMSLLGAFFDLLV